MSVFLQIADRIALQIVQAGVLPSPDLMRYGRSGMLPEGAPRGISAELGDSMQSAEFFGATSWITEMRMHLEARPVAGVHRTPMHAADELMACLLQAIRWSDDAADAFGAGMRALGARGYCDASGSLGPDPMAPSRIERDVHATSTPVGVITLTLYIRHDTVPGTLTPMTEDA